MTAFLACGAERSGTRMLTHAIAAAGATYLPINMRTYPHEQLERMMKDANIVLHFSLPKQSHWPDLQRFRMQLEERGYLVQPVGIMRDWHANISSLMSWRVKSREQGEKLIRRAWTYLWDTFPNDLLVVNYEAFIDYPEVRKRILVEDLGLPKSPERLETKEIRQEFENQNAKWYEEAS